MLSPLLLKLVVLNFKMTDICSTPCFFPSTTTSSCHPHSHPGDTFITSCARKKRKEALPQGEDAAKKPKQVELSETKFGEEHVTFYDACECLESDHVDQENVHMTSKEEQYTAVAVTERPGLLQTVLACISSPVTGHAQPSEQGDVELPMISTSEDSECASEDKAMPLQAVPDSYITQAAPAHTHDDEEDEYDYFDPLLFMKNLPPLECCIAQNRPTLLPKQTRRCKQKTLVLDLDETLVHSSMEPIPSPDFSFVVDFNNQQHSVHVKTRPNLDVFLQRAAELFEVVVFTASQKVYAEKLLNLMDPERKLVRYRIYRDSCVVVDGNYLKDLTVLGRDMRHTFIVDNSPQAFGFQVDNGIPIESWYDDQNDKELLNLLPFLESLADVEDVRPYIQQRFRLKELITRSCEPARCA